MLPLADTISFFSPLQINCGRQALSHLPFELAARGLHAPLVLADGEKIGRRALDRVVDAFRASGMILGIYDRVPDEPAPDLIPVLAGMFRDGACDSLVVVGCGAVVDTAKCLNLSVSAYPASQGDSSPRMSPLVLVATPGGNGDEVTGYAFDGERRMSSTDLIPSLVIIDPAMMPMQDERGLVNGALLALVHAVEAFCDDGVGPSCHAYAHAAIRLIMQNLLTGLRSSSQRNQHRLAVVNGQVAAGSAFFAAGAGICHGLASRLKETTELPTGFLMAVLLPHLIEVAADVYTGRVGALLYSMAGSDSYAVTHDDLKVPRVIALVWEFFEALNAELDDPIPASLADAGITREQIDRVLSRYDGLAVEDAVKRIIDGALKGIPVMAE
ncbi:putative Alcohol dehydrogenase [Desulfosarcina cetonica]|uniref:iron-containing alcohol dehydrogenase n=1 Tax=Desulfosarcina cetonica TaxID=90730 RepID=UPI0006D16C82|nr:iron-containing alcohol dehydrogenase [Desulfosarcina cetonica]VTR65175.1 putative Alcohol dehydrogenase [Desulfosarcina cetonica]